MCKIYLLRKYVIILIKIHSNKYNTHFHHPIIYYLLLHVLYLFNIIILLYNNDINSCFYNIIGIHNVNTEK